VYVDNSKVQAIEKSHLCVKQAPWFISDQSRLLAEAAKDSANMMINLTNTVPTMHVDVSTQKQDNEPLINIGRKIDKIEQDIQSLKSVALQPRLTEPNIPTNKSLPNQSENQKSIQKHNESENKFTYSVHLSH
jgi:small-conductance mechanosensitive channel